MSINDENMEIRFIDLFAGIGGFRYGLESINGSKNRGIKSNSQKDDETGKGLESKKGESVSTKTGRHDEQLNSKSKQRTFTCVYTNEWDKYAAQIYKKHFGECDTRDITTVPSSDIPNHDLLVGGFPCQAFSIAGKRKGFDDTRGTLFFEIARILRDKRPRYFILENVKGLLSHDKGKTFQTILGVLSDLGYEYQWQVLMLVGTASMLENATKHGEGELHPKEGCLTVQENGRKLVKLFGNGIMQPVGDAETDSTILKELLKFTTLDHLNTEVSEQRLITLSSFVIRAIIGFIPQEILTQDTFTVKIDTKVGYTYGISDTQRYKCLGNAVTTNVIAYLASKLIK